MTLGLVSMQFCLQSVWFVTFQLSVFTLLHRTIDRNSATVGKGVNYLFLGLLAVFRKSTHAL